MRFSHQSKFYKKYCCTGCEMCSQRRISISRKTPLQRGSHVTDLILESRISAFSEKICLVQPCAIEQLREVTCMVSRDFVKFILLAQLLHRIDTSRLEQTIAGKTSANIGRDEGL